MPESERKEKVKTCKTLYENAIKIAKEKLKVSDNLRLRLMMNYGFFGDEWLNQEGDKIKAKQEVEKTFNEALEEIETLTEDEFVKAASILSEMDDLNKQNTS